MWSAVMIGDALLYSYFILYFSEALTKSSVNFLSIN